MHWQVDFFSTNKREYVSGKLNLLCTNFLHTLFFYLNKFLCMTISNHYSFIILHMGKSNLMVSLGMRNICLMTIISGFKKCYSDL